MGFLNLQWIYQRFKRIDIQASAKFCGGLCHLRMDSYNMEKIRFQFQRIWAQGKYLTVQLYKTKIWFLISILAECITTSSSAMNSSF